MRILFLNNDGAGFADYVNVTDGTTVEQFFTIKMEGREPSDYLIRVNRRPVQVLTAQGLILQPGPVTELKYPRCSQLAVIFHTHSDGLFM